jgi:hypothetical protein
VSEGAISRHTVALAGGAALAVTAALAAGCAKNVSPPPSTTTITTTDESPTGAAPSAKDKDLGPSNGNLFTPQVKAPPAGTVPPGLHPGINGVP